MTRRRIAVTLGGVLLLVGVVAAIAMLLLVDQLTSPRPSNVGNPPAGFEPVSLDAGGPGPLRGWLSGSGSRGPVLLLPGVRADRTSMLGRARFLASAGHPVLLVDLRGTGESPGELITMGWEERLDVLAAAGELRRRFPGRAVAVLGTSLGGAAALLATPPLAADALILEAVYPTLREATADRLEIRGGRFGRLLAPLLLFAGKARYGIDADRLRPIDHIANVAAPVFVLGGSEDPRTTEGETRRLFAAARDPKELWIVPGASHVDLHRHAGAEYERRILRFLDAAETRFSGARH